MSAVTAPSWSTPIGVRRWTMFLSALLVYAVITAAGAAARPVHTLSGRAMPTGGSSPFAFTLDPAARIRHLESIVTGTITIGGPATTVTISTAGDDANITFSGTAGQYLGLGVSPVTIGTSTCCSSFVSVLKPDGGTLKSPTAFGTNGTTINIPVLPSTGTYTIVIDPQGTATGSATLTLSEDVASTITIGGATASVTMSRIGQNGRVTFSGTAGQYLGIALSNVTLGTSACCSGIVSVLKPDGSTLTIGRSFGTNGGTLNVPVLPSTGTYTIFVDPYEVTATGSVTLTLSEDLSATTAVGGDSTSVTISRIGQNARVTFTGTAGEPLLLALTNVTLGTSTCCSGLVSVLNPDGSTLQSATAFGTNGASLSLPLLTASGTHTIFLDPYQNDLSTGSITVALTQNAAFEPPEQTYGDCDGGIDGLSQSDCLGDINGASGAFSTSATDVSLPGVGVPFSFTRNYTSVDATVGRLGRGWTDGYAASLQFQPNGDVVLHGENGQQLMFAKQSNGTFVAPTGGLGALSSGGGTYTYLRSDQTKLTFDSQGRLTAVKDRNTQGVTLAYDGSGRLSTITDSASRQINFTSNADGTISQLALPDGRHVNYGYTSGRLTSVTDMRGGTVTYTYDASNRLASITDENNHTVTQNTYGADGRLSSQLDALNHQTTYSWDSGSSTQTVTDARGNAWKDVYSKGMLIKRIDPLGNTIQYAYDAKNDLTTLTDARGKVTTMAYDARHNMLTKTAPSPLSYQETWTYDSKNDVLSYKDGRGNTVSYAYDANGNRISMTEPGSVVTQYAYAAGGTGLLTAKTDPRGKVTNYAYDSAGNLTSVTTSLGHTTTFGYDSSGRLISKIDPRGNVSGANPTDFETSYAYNAIDLKLTETDPLGGTTSWAYDPGGNLTSVTDANGHQTTYAYDAGDRLTSVTAANGAVTSYTYDNVGNLTGRTDTNNHASSFTFDAADRLASAIDALNRTWTYAYDANGNRTTLTNPDNGVVSYGYDVLNRQTSIGFSDTTPGSTYSYDGNGNRTQMVDGSGTQSYVYDARNRLTSVTRGGDTFSYTYDDANDITSRTYPGGAATSSTYDDDGRLVSAASGGATTGYAYDVAGNLTTTTLPASNGYVETRAYDRAGRLTQVKNADGPNVLSQFDYSYDAVGNPTRINEVGGSVETFDYDVRDRLMSVCYQAACPSGTDPYIRWTYDGVGNRLTETRPVGTTNYAYDAADQLVQAAGPGGTTSYAYDARGNQTQSGSRTFTFDLANRLKSTTLTGVTYDYTYDGDGNRLSATTAGGSTNFVWDLNNDMPELAIERDGSGATLRSYTYGDGAVSMKEAGQSYYFHYDGLGSVVNLTSATGATEWTYSYEPFGSARTTTQNDPNAPANVLRFTGQYLDPTGLYYLRARMQDPETGRFLSIDPKMPAATDPYVSAYVYADDRPSVLRDPDGEDPWGKDRLRAKQKRKTRKFLQAVATFLVDNLGIPKENLGKLEVRPTRNGKGIRIRLKGSDPTNNANEIRIMQPTKRYPNGYMRYTDKGGRYINPRTGQPTGRKDPQSHIDLGTYKGPFKNLPFTAKLP